MGDPFRVSLQTYTIRRELKNRKALDRTLGRVRELGFSSLELSRVPFGGEYLSIFDEARRSAGLSVGSTQMKLKEIGRDPAHTAALNRKLGSRFCVVSVISFSHLAKGEEGLKRYSEGLNSLGRKMAGEGVALLFHHHNFEFVALPGGSDGFSYLKRYLDPEAVGFVFDTYWLQRSGHDPARFIRENAGRVKGVHLRDFSLKGPLFNPSIRDAEAGAGNLDFPEIIRACRECGVSYGAVEQNSAAPWDSLEKSAKYLKSIGVDI